MSEDVKNDIEIERRFLVKGIPKSIYPSNFITKATIHQGYVLTGENETGNLRVRKIFYEVKNECDYYLTIKKRINDITNQEIEFEILASNFLRMWKLVGKRYVEKIRWTFFDNREKYKSGKVIYTIDEYKGYNKGIYIFEVEFLNEEDARNWKPFPWLDRELIDGEMSAHTLAKQNEKKYEEGN